MHVVLKGKHVSVTGLNNSCLISNYSWNSNNPQAMLQFQLAEIHLQHFCFTCSFTHLKEKNFNFKHQRCDNKPRKEEDSYPLGKLAGIAIENLCLHFIGQDAQTMMSFLENVY